jgi:hypothetical protein
VDELGGLARLGEADRPEAPLDEIREELRALPERAGAELKLLVEKRWIPESHRPCRMRGRVLSDHCRLHAEQGLDELTRIRNRGRRQQELGLGSVDRRCSPQPAQHVGDVRAEDAAVDVRLVNDDVAEVLQHVAPAVVVR